jgi:hypothetical protein
MTSPAPRGHSGTPKMGRPWRNNTSDHDSGLLSIFLITILLATSIHVNPLQYYSAMGVTMRAVTSKEKPTKTMITPKQAQQPARISKSPRSENINSLLAEINLPVSRFDNVLEALRPSTRRGSNNNDSLNNPCNLEPPTDKNNQIIKIASLTRVDTLPLGVGSLSQPTMPIPQAMRIHRINRTHPTEEYILMKWQYKLNT